MSTPVERDDLRLHSGNGVYAIVVTYNRKDLLVECVNALLHYDDLRIIVVDNASSDGTDHLASSGGILDHPRIGFIRLKENEGGAGGFYWGLRTAHELGAQYTWLMDDDVEPLPNALMPLIDLQAKPNVGFTCSAVRDPSKTISMNLPSVADSSPVGKYPSWDEYLSEGVVKISAATFVSVLFSRAAVDKCGFPNRKFFIWGDDKEYTLRISSAGYMGLMSGHSVVLHKRAQVGSLSLVTEENINRIRMMKNLYRNTVWIELRKKTFLGAATVIYTILQDTFLIVFKSRSLRSARLKSLYSGLYEALFQRLENEQGWQLKDAASVRTGFVAEGK